MENNLKFNSSICTSIEQSKRLLELGLKKETADMVHCAYGVDGGTAIRPFCWLSFSEVDMENFIPAWSLHRLMEIMYNGDMFGFVDLTTHSRNIDTIYELVIANIEGLIKIDRFNKDYLEETICQQD